MSDGHEEIQPTTGGDSRTLTLESTPSAALKLLKEKAEIWGGGWKGEGLTGGRLVIPVLAGLRRGYVGYGVSVDGTPRKTTLDFKEEESDLQVHVPTLIVLLIAAAAGLTTMVIPFMPRLLPLLPPSVVLSLATWLFIVARLRNSGIDEFLADLADDVQADER